MKIETDRGGRVTVSSNASFFAASLAFCGLATSAGTAYMLMARTVETKALIGAGISAVMFLGAAALFFERSRFVFDPGTRTVGWSRRRLRSEKSGRLNFDQIKAVVLQRRSDEKNANLRIALETTAGELPLTLAYSGNNRQLEDVARAIRTVIGMSGDLVDDSIRAAVAAGRTIDAVAIARTTPGLSLTEAKNLVDEIAAESRRPKS